MFTNTLKICESCDDLTETVVKTESGMALCCRCRQKLAEDPADYYDPWQFMQKTEDAYA